MKLLTLADGNSTTPMTWNEFQHAHKGEFTRSQMSEAWAQYKAEMGIQGGSGSTSNEVVWNNGWGTKDGRFASPQGNQRAGGWAEEAVWNAIAQKDGWEVRTGRVYAVNGLGEVRVYDGAAISPSGHVIGLEVKSGGARYGGSQKSFDSRVSISNPAKGTGQNKGLIITHVLVIRRTQ